MAEESVCKREGVGVSPHIPLLHQIRHLGPAQLESGACDAVQAHGGFESLYLLHFGLRNVQI